MQKADPLIRTKIRQPFTRPGLVPRPRLQAQIARGLCAPLTLITAPAGFGKSTLVASSIASCRMPVAWLSLDKHDNQAGRFLRYLIAALQAVDPIIGSEAAQLVADIQPARAEAILTNLINDLDNANTEMALVLDDYHQINSQAAHEAVVFLLDHCPNTFHLVIATRSDPPLPLARLRARGQVVELRAADLRFSESEAALFLNDVMGLHLDAGSVAKLEERTEGWIAGLQMASIALQPHLSMPDRKDASRFIEGFSGTNRYILDYLLEEVLACQPPEIQQFLLHTSILERLTAPLCDALLAGDERHEPSSGEGGSHAGSPDIRQSASVLNYLERENLFLVSLDDDYASGAGLAWFRYHHLFTDLLKARLQQTQPDWVPQLHIRASAWLEQQGFILEAIQHLFAAHAVGRAADLIERYGPVHWAESDLSVVQMADSLPREMLIDRPKIGIYQAWLLINQGLIEKALPLLIDMAHQLAARAPNPAELWIQTIIGLALAFLGKPAITPGFDPLPDPYILDEIPAEVLVMRDAANILYGMALARRGKDDQAAEFAVMCLRKEKAPGWALPSRRMALPTLVPFLATLYVFQGRLHAAAALCREYLEPIKEKGLRISTAGNLDIVLGEVLYEWNRLEEAEQHICDGLQANEPWGNIMTDGFGLIALTHVRQAKGDFAGAMQAVDKFTIRLQEQSRPVEFREDFHTLQVRLQLASGDLQTAAHWADQIQHSQDFQLHPEYFRLTLAYIRLAQGRYAEVEEILSRIPPQELNGNGLTRQIEYNVLLAAALTAQQHAAEAVDLIEACLALAAPEGYLRIFLNFGETARELLVAYLRSDAPAQKDYAQNVLAALAPARRAGSPGAPSASLVEPLTQRELEVLDLMALGRTNLEIARQLVVARGTIKAHAASIYRKLEVSNRTEAVARARQLGILA